MSFASIVEGLTPSAFYRCQDTLPASFASEVISLSPYSFYRLQDGAGGTIVDSSGNSRNGTTQGVVTYFGDGLVWDGRASNSILVGTNPTLGSLKPSVNSSAPGIANSAFTIGFYWQPTQTAISYLATANNSTVTGTTGWLLILTGTNLALSINQSSYNLGTVNASVTYSAAGIAVGVEQLYWLTYDGAGNWAVYINGSSTALMTVSSVVLSVPSTPTMVIGGLNSQNTCSGGYFAEVMTFGSVVSAANRLAVYNAGLPGALTDSSGNSHNGQFGGIVTPGQTGLVFDGNTAGSTLVSTNPVLGFLTPPNTLPGAANAAFTIGFFWKPTQVATSYIAGSGDNTSSSGWNLAMDGTYLYLCINLNGFSGTLYKARATYAAAGIAVGVPQFYCLTYDGTANWALYVNGNSTPLFTVSATLMVTPTFKQLDFGSYAGLPYCSGGDFAEIMLFNSVISTANMAAIYAAGVQFSPLNAPIITATNGPGPILNWTATSGGTSPYTYNLYRSTAPFVYPDASSSLVYSGTSTTFTDAAPPEVLEYYVVNAVDSSAPQKSGASNVMTAMFAPTVYVGMIGDSRTQGYNPQGTVSTASLLVAALEPMLSGYGIVANNRGIGGTTSTNWAPSASGGGNDIVAAVGSISSAASSLPTGSKVYLQIMLGVNDSKIDVRTPLATYTANIQAIISYILNANIPFFAGILLHQSWGMDVGLISDFDATSVQYVINYNAALASLVNGKTVFQGDQKLYNFFALNPSFLTDGLHPYTTGYTFASYEHAATYALIQSGGGGVVPTGTTYPAGLPLSQLISGNVQANVPWTVPAKGVPGSTGSVQSGSTSVSVAFASGAAAPLCNMLDTLISNGKATIL